MNAEGATLLATKTASDVGVVHLMEVVKERKTFHIISTQEADVFLSKTPQMLVAKKKLFAFVKKVQIYICGH